MMLSSGQPNTVSVRFRPKYVSVSAFRLSPLSVIRPKHFFRPKEAVSAKMTLSAKRVHIIIF